MWEVFFLTKPCPTLPGFFTLFKFSIISWRLTSISFYTELSYCSFLGEEFYHRLFQLFWNYCDFQGLFFAKYFDCFCNLSFFFGRSVLIIYSNYFWIFTICWGRHVLLFFLSCYHSVLIWRMCVFVFYFNSFCRTVVFLGW